MNWRDEILKEYKEHNKNCSCVFCEEKIMELEEEEIKTCDYCNHEMLAEDGAFCSEDCAKGYFSDIT